MGVRLNFYPGDDDTYFFIVARIVYLDIFQIILITLLMEIYKYVSTQILHIFEI